MGGRWMRVRGAGAAALAAGWLLAQAGTALAAPGFGVKGGSAGSARASSPGGASAGSRSSAGGATRSQGSFDRGGTATRSQGSVGRSRDSFDRGGVAPRSDGRSSVGWGTRPDYDGGGRPNRGSRDRFYDGRGNDGGYGFPDRRGGRRDRYYPYYQPFFYTSPFYSPFTPFSWGYDPFYGTFGYSDWYTSTDRRRPLERVDGYDEEWPESRRGNVVLDIEPRDVEVRINGVRATGDGRAVIDLPTGTYRVEVSRRYYRAWVTELVVSQGVRYRLEQRLERLPRGEEGAFESGPAPRLVGELILNVTPDDAVVTLDERLLGIVNLLQGGAALRSIPVGKHVIELKRPGYKTETREITLDPRESLKISVAMERE